jgi:hypothetical protein
MRDLNHVLDELYIFKDFAEKQNKKVSSASVRWHIEHSLLVILKVSESVCKSDPGKYKNRFNLWRALVFPLNKFSRGIGKAPEIVKPKKSEQVDLEEMFKKTREMVRDLYLADENQFSKHPIFGILNKEKNFIMLDIHTHHHIKIIRDILAGS